MNPTHELDHEPARIFERKSRENVHRIWMAARIVFYGLAITVFTLILWGWSGYELEDEFYLGHLGFKIGSLSFAGDVNVLGGLEVGVGTGGFLAAPNLHYKGQGVNIVGFVLSDLAYSTNNGLVKSHWLTAGLPWWFVAALFFGPRLDRLAIRMNAARDARRRHRKETAKYQESLKFKRDPVCRKCGYDMRATRDRCPECGWIPDFPPPAEQQDQC